MAEIGSGVWGAPRKFQGVSRLGFVTAATFFTGGQPNFERCLAVSWAGTLYIHFSGGFCPLTEFCHVLTSLCIQVLHSRVLARHSTSRRQPNFAACYKEWNYGTFADCLTYIRLGSHHVVHWLTVLLVTKIMVRGSGADNTGKENSSVFYVIGMC